MRPISIEAINDDLILIDESLNRITRYTYTSENGLQLKNSGTHNLNMSDMCISSGAIWVYAQSQNKIMHQISSDLNKVSKFIDGQFNIQEKPSMLEIASTGLIACNSKYIYNGFTKDNEIRIYNVNDGSLHKKIQFEEITPLKISAVSNPDGNPRFSFQYYQGDAYDDKGDYHDTLKNLTLINGHLLVQYERSFSNDESGQQHIISLYFDPKDGTYTLHKDWPLVYDYNGNNFLTGTEYPIPKLNIYMFDK